MKKHYYKDIIPRLEYLANNFYIEDVLLNIAIESDDMIERLENNLQNIEIIDINNKEKNVKPKQKHSNISLILLGFIKGMKNASKSKKKTIPDWVYD